MFEVVLIFLWSCCLCA